MACPENKKTIKLSEIKLKFLEMFKISRVFILSEKEIKDIREQCIIAKTDKKIIIK